MTEKIERYSYSSKQLHALFSIEDRAGASIQVNLTVNQEPLTMELDTGA